MRHDAIISLFDAIIECNDANKASDDAIIFINN
jgi:hypothetical protein